jgi:uncharacterized protein with PhoU and TrkA domain
MARESYLRKGRDGSATEVMEFVALIFDLERGVSDLCFENREGAEEENDGEEAIDACSMLVSLLLFLRVRRAMSAQTDQA